MKKFILALALAFSLALPVIAQSQDDSAKEYIWDHGDNVSDLSYKNVTIYKVYDQAENYVVLYEKHGIKIGQCNVPKAWIKSQDGNAPRLELRTLAAGLDPYMSVYYKNGSFYKVVLTLPVSRLDATWGVLPHNIKVSTDVDNFNIEY